MRPGDPSVLLAVVVKEASRNETELHLIEWHSTWVIWILFEFTDSFSKEFFLASYLVVIPKVLSVPLN